MQKQIELSEDVTLKGGDLWPSRFPFLSGLLFNWSCFIAEFEIYFFRIDSYWQGREIGKRERAEFSTLYCNMVQVRQIRLGNNRKRTNVKTCTNIKSKLITMNKHL